MDTPSSWSILTSLASMIVIWFDLIKSALASLAWPATVLTALLVFRKDIAGLVSKLASLKVAGGEAVFAHGVHQLGPLGSAEEAKAAAVANAAAAAAAAAEVAAGADVEAGAEAAPPGPDDLHEEQDAPANDAAAHTSEQNDGNKNGRISDRTTDSVREKLSANSQALFELLNKSSQITPGARSPMDIATWASSLRDYFLAHSIDGAAAKDLNEARLIATNSPSGAVLLAWRAIEGILQQIPVPEDLAGISSSVAKHRWRTPSTVMRYLNSEAQIDSETYERFYDLQKLRNSVAHASRFSAAPADVLEYIDRAEELATTLTSVVTRLTMTKPPTLGPRDDL